jgi:hypothetical protein
MVRRQRHSPNKTDGERDDREAADFQGRMAGRRQAEPEEVALERPVHEREIGGQVQLVSGDNHHHECHDLMASLPIALEQKEQEQARDYPNDVINVSHKRALGGTGRREVRVDVRSNQDDRERQHGEYPAQPEGLREVARERALVARANRLREKSVEGEHAGDTDVRERPKEIAGQPEARERIGADPASHQRVHDAHGHVAHLREDDGPGELQRLLQLRAPSRLVFML